MLMIRRPDRDGSGDAQQVYVAGEAGRKDVVSALHAGYGRSCLTTYAREHIIERQPTCNAHRMAQSYGDDTEEARPAAKMPTSP